MAAFGRRRAVRRRSGTGPFRGPETAPGREKTIKFANSCKIRRNYAEYAIDNRDRAFYPSHLTWTNVSVRITIVEGESMADNKAPAKAKARTKTATYQELATVTNLSKKQVAGFFDEL